MEFLKFQKVQPTFDPAIRRGTFLETSLMRAAFPENQRQVEESPCDEARVQRREQRERRGGRRHRRRRM